VGGVGVGRPYRKIIFVPTTFFRAARRPQTKAYYPQKLNDNFILYSFSFNKYEIQFIKQRKYYGKKKNKPINKRKKEIQENKRKKTNAKKKFQKINSKTKKR
jgi:hypothetical protein